MSIREHALVFWEMVRRWPRSTAIVLGGFAVFYFLYYAGVEAMEIPESLAAALGMVLMLVALKAAGLIVFYSPFHHDAFSGSFVILAAFAAVPFVLALAIALIFVRQEIEGPPPDAIAVLLAGSAVVFTFGIAAAARVGQWAGSLLRR
jgi:hypothetical protein